MCLINFKNSIEAAMVHQHNMVHAMLLLSVLLHIPMRIAPLPINYAVDCTNLNAYPVYNVVGLFHLYELTHACEWCVNLRMETTNACV